MKFLADVNVVFPLLVSRHAHRAAAVEWFNSASVGDVVLCRLVRLGTLRLLTTKQVMGPDVLQPKAAIEALAAFEKDERVLLLQEPDGLDASLKKLAAPCASTPNLWSDVYLAAFAMSTHLEPVSFDRGLSKFGIPYVLLKA